MNVMSKQIRAMLRGMSNTSRLKSIRYAALLIDINEYLDVLHGEKAIYNNDEMELNKIFLESIPNGWVKKAYVQGFDCGTIDLRTYVNMFEHM